MIRQLMMLVLCGLLAAAQGQAAEKLVLDLEMDRDLISLAHNIDGFLFKPTMNFSPDVPGNLSASLGGDTLKHHLAATALVRIGDEVVGIATEQEKVLIDEATGKHDVQSAWLITLYGPGRTGVLAVAQREDPAGTFGLVSQVMQDPKGNWDDEFHRFLSTSGDARVQLATGDLAPYRGGRFEEYNFVNPSDLKNFGRFRARIQFVIYPGP